MAARQAPLLIGAGAAVVAIAAAVILVRSSPKAITAEAGAPASASAVATASAAASGSAEPVASGSASASASAPASASASAAITPATAPRDAGGHETVASSLDAGAASAEAGTGRPRVVSIDESNDGKTVELSPGQSLVATLNANPTTGFDWAVIKAPAALGAPEMGYVSGGSAPGSPGKRHLTWTLKATLPPGEHAVELGYARSFEKGVPPFKTYRFKVRAPSR
jgi:inhibitor of cysteine peptidase